MAYHGGEANDAEWGPKTRGYALAGMESIANFRGTDWVRDLNASAEAAAKLREEQERVADAIRKGLDPARELRAELDRATEAYRAGTITGEEYAAEQARLAGKLAETGAEIIRQRNPLQELAQWWRDTLDPMREHIAKLDELTRLYRAGALAPGDAAENERLYRAGQGVIARDMRETAEGMQQPAGEQFNAMTEMAKEAAQQIHQAFADFLYRPWEEGLRGMLESFVDMLHQMAAQILAQQAIMAFARMMGGTAGGTDIWSAVLGGALKMFHSGGTVGRDGDPLPRRGLQADEVPAILQTGERVLSRQEVATLWRWAPRFHTGGLVGGSDLEALAAAPRATAAPAPATAAPVRIVNTVAPDVARDWLESAAGERVIMNVIRRRRLEMSLS
jgi:hypothetical protein